MRQRAFSTRPLDKYKLTATKVTVSQKNIQAEDAIRMAPTPSVVPKSNPDGTGT